MNDNSSNQTSPTQQLPNVIETDHNADRLIFKWSVWASASNILTIIPGSKIIVDIIGDTIVQYKMIDDIAKLYSVDSRLFDAKKILAIILDNLAAKKATSWIIDFIPIVGKFASAIFDFSYTFLIGKAFKYLFRKAAQEGGEVKVEDLPLIIRDLMKDVKDYIIKNWIMIIRATKFTLEKYDVDLRKLANEFQESNNNKDYIMVKAVKFFEEIFNELKLQTITMVEFFTVLKEIEAELKIPSIELVKAQIGLAELKGEPIDSDLLIILEFLEGKEFDN